MEEVNFCVVIPAFNSEKTLAELLERVFRVVLSKQKILVVDDGSTDKTLEIAKNFGVDFLKHTKNKGKGEALKTAFLWAKEKNFDFVLTLDADLQHLPELIPLFLENQKKTKSDLVIGSRMKVLSKMPVHRIASNKITSFLLSLRTKQKIEDSQSGFRLHSKRLLEKLNLVSSRYELESELLIKAGLQGFKITFVDVPTIYNGEKSEIRVFRDVSNFVKIYFKSLF
ncbi:glycosyltransferase family 2 protein [bacterium]|nr:glycosyltransferase family 2 protein [bacterium]